MRRLPQWIAGISVYAVLTWLFDYVGYSIVIWKLGLIQGGIVMAILAFFLDWYSVKYYNYLQTDWLAMEYIKSLRNYEGKNKIKRMTKYILTKTSRPIQIIFFSLKFNPFITTIMMSTEAFNPKGMTRQDWRTFIISHVIGQLYWIFVIAGGVYGLMALFYTK